MAPSMTSADPASMVKVNGTSTATAIVAVRPGNAPITVPATTPMKARSRLPTESAARRLGSRSNCRDSATSLDHADVARRRLVLLPPRLHERVHLLVGHVHHHEAAFLHLLPVVGILVDLGEQVRQLLALRLGRRLGHGDAAIDAGHHLDPELL